VAVRISGQFRLLRSGLNCFLTYTQG
jgi:hypothetical protein